MALHQYSWLNWMSFGNGMLYHWSEEIFWDAPHSFELLTEYCHIKSFKVFRCQTHADLEKSKSTCRPSWPALLLLTTSSLLEVPFPRSEPVRQNLGVLLTHATASQLPSFASLTQVTTANCREQKCFYWAAQAWSRREFLFMPLMAYMFLNP